MSVCLSQAGIGIIAKWMNGSTWYLAGSLPSTWHTLCFKEIPLSPKQGYFCLLNLFIYVVLGYHIWGWNKVVYKLDQIFCACYARLHLARSSSGDNANVVYLHFVDDVAFAHNGQAAATGMGLCSKWLTEGSTGGEVCCLHGRLPCCFSDLTVLLITEVGLGMHG